MGQEMPGKLRNVSWRLPFRAVLKLTDSQIRASAADELCDSADITYVLGRSLHSFLGPKASSETE